MDNKPQSSTVWQPVKKGFIIVDNDKNCTKYKFGDLITKSKRGYIYEVIRLDIKKQMACKVIVKKSLEDLIDRERTLNDAKIHRKLLHVNIVTYQAYVDDFDHIYLVMELFERGTLAQLLQRRKLFHELEVQHYAIVLLILIKFLHNKNIIHRNITLDHIGLTQRLEIKLSNFTLAHQFGDDKFSHEVVGLIQNQLPEMLLQQEYSFEVDLWAYGLFLYTMLVGKHPFESESEGKTRRTIKKVQWSLPKDEERFISEDARDLVSRLLHPIKEKRPKLQEIESHAFFRRNKIPVQLPMFCYSVMPNEESHGVMWKKVQNRTKVISAQDEKVEDEQVKSLNQDISPKFQKVLSNYKGLVPLALKKNIQSLPQLESQQDPQLQLIKPLAATPQGHQIIADLKKRISKVVYENNNTIKTSSISSLAIIEDDAPNGQLIPRKNKRLPPIRNSSSTKEVINSSFAQTLNFETQPKVPLITSPSPQLLEGNTRNQAFYQIKSQLDMGISSQFQAKAKAVLLSATLPPEQSNPFLNVKPDIFMTKWVHSTKYGLGFILNCNKQGLFFNDKTRMICDENSLTFLYCSKAQEKKKKLISYYKFSDVPDELLQKVKIFQNIRKFLKGDSASTQYIKQSALKNLDGSFIEKPRGTYFIKKWKKSSKGTLFQLSTQLIQVYFKDSTEIFIYVGQDLKQFVTFVNAEKVSVTMLMENVRDKNVLSRMKLAREILQSKESQNVEQIEGQPNTSPVKEKSDYFEIQSPQNRDLKLNLIETPLQKTLKAKISNSQGEVEKIPIEQVVSKKSFGETLVDEILLDQPLKQKDVVGESTNQSDAKQLKELELIKSPLTKLSRQGGMKNILNRSKSTKMR